MYACCWLDSNDITGNPEWACTSLKFFGSPITGIPRPDFRHGTNNALKYEIQEISPFTNKFTPNWPV